MSSDATEIAKIVSNSGKSSKWRLDERMESLQRAEDNYYRSNNNQDKQVNTDSCTHFTMVASLALQVKLDSY